MLSFYSRLIQPTNYRFLFNPSHFLCYPLSMPSHESIVTVEINFPLLESNYSPLPCPTVNYLPIASLNAGIPFLYPFYHPFLTIHPLRSHRLSVHPFSSLSIPFSSLSIPLYPSNIQIHHHISSQQTRKSMFTVWVKSGLHILQAHSNRSGSNSASLHSITSPRSITIFFACFSVISTDYIAPPPSLLRSQWTYQRSHQSSARSSLLRGTFSAAACDR